MFLEVAGCRLNRVSFGTLKQDTLFYPNTQINLLLQLYNTSSVRCSGTLKLMDCVSFISTSYCKPVFNQDQEKELAEFVFVMETRFLGLMLTEIRRLAFNLAERNEISHNFNKAKKMAG
jgi:hypothetical protein